MEKVFILAIILSVLSCKESLVTFEEAQPENVKNELFFPKHITGVFYNFEDNSEIFISEKQIVKKIILKDTFKISELDKNQILKGDTIFNTKTNEKVGVEIINDTLFTNYIHIDTIFRIDQNGVLRKFRGFYFLNTKLENEWSVEKLNLKKGVLTINNISTEIEIENLESITEAKRDSVVPFKIKPTKKQFIKFINENGFSEGESYLKK